MYPLYASLTCPGEFRSVNRFHQQAVAAQSNPRLGTLFHCEHTRAPCVHSVGGPTKLHVPATTRLPSLPWISCNAPQTQKAKERNEQTVTSGQQSGGRTDGQRRPHDNQQSERATTATTTTTTTVSRQPLTSKSSNVRSFVRSPLRTPPASPAQGQPTTAPQHHSTTATARMHLHILTVDIVQLFENSVIE